MKYTISEAEHALTRSRSVCPPDVSNSLTVEFAEARGRAPSFLTTKDRDLLCTCPTPGSGVHAWTFRVLRMLSKHYVSEEKLFQAAKMVFTEFATREVPDADILRQIPNVLKGSDVQILSGSTRGDSYKKWPLADIRKMESILAEGVTLSVLRAKSPFVLGEIVPSARYILDTLFPRDPLLCCGLETKKVVTHPRSVWGYPGYLQFIVPSPMSKAFGLNKAGKQSHRCLDNTGPRRFLVVEFDFKADVEACESSIATRQTLSRPSAEQLNALEKAKFVRSCLERGLLVQDI